jgi:hypothetical protein
VSRYPDDVAVPPHLPHSARRWNDGTSTPSAYFDTVDQGLMAALAPNKS